MRELKNESKLIQLQINESHRDFNTIYSVKINYRGPNVGKCSKPFQPAAAINEIQMNITTACHVWLSGVLTLVFKYRLNISNKTAGA